jgi:hypothetical protein
MPDTNISRSAIGDNSTTFVDYSVDTAITDGATGIGETEYINSRADEFLGYYKNIAELKASIDAKATWTVGKGFRADPLTTFYCNRIKGFGVDTFNSILENCVRSYHIYGDSFCEIIRDDEGMLINLKPLDPKTIKIVANAQGKIVRYEQISKAKDGKTRKLDPKKIFHLCKNRIADEIHGTSIIPAMEWIILARNEAMADYKKMLHRNIYPVRIWHLDTDKEEKITAFKAQVAAAKYTGEDHFIPKGAVETEIAAIPANSTLNPMAWIDKLNQYFFEACGTPKIVIGNAADFTESSVKIVYLAWEQTIEEEQLYLEEQTGMQLGLGIELEFPATLQNELLSDVAKDGTLQQNMNQPSQTQITPNEAGQ